MTRRPLAWTRRAALWAGALGLTALAGCDPRQALYFLQPFEPTIAPPCPGLEKKRVVLIAKATPGARNDSPTIDRELSREVCKILREKVKKIDLVDMDKVWAWDQAHPSWTDPAELAEKFEADIAIFFEISEFQIQSPTSPELFEGKAKVNVQVVELAHPKDSRGREMRDQAKKAEIIYTDDHDTVFPINGPMPASTEFSAPVFKRKFLHIVATELSWYFVEHASGDNIHDAKIGRD
jgi:hypothetical protein